jgi:hypothetical protein
VMDIVEPGFFDFDLGVSHCFWKALVK